MSHGTHGVDRGTPWRPHGGYPPGGSGPDLKKIVGMGLGLVGAVSTLYGAGSGVKKLIEVSLNNFGSVLVVSIINFVFWSVITLNPLVGCGANILGGIGLVALFGGVSAIPGVAIMVGGAVIYNA